MNRTFQTIILALYRAVSATGLLSTRPGRAVYEWSYDRYKEHFEARHVDALRPYVKPGTTVVDVGANIGFFTRRFGRWVGAGGRVIAIEPEPANVAALTRAISRAGLEGVVEAVEGAAAEAGGTLRLQLNPSQPTDHRLGERGIAVNAFTVDEILEKRGWPRVSLCKIDVQGAEERVLRGMTRTLEKFRPALFVEVESGAQAESLLAHLAELGYRPRLLEKDGASPPLSPARALALSRAAGYLDFLFLADA